MRIRITACLALLVSTAVAQVNYQQQYSNGKLLFRNGKYNLAMETFKSLITYDQRNPFTEYASYYYALSAYNQGYGSVAKDMFSQIKKLYPNWDQIDEVNLWLARSILRIRTISRAFACWRKSKITEFIRRVLR
jgi:TolA-binding protein